MPSSPDDRSIDHTLLQDVRSGDFRAVARLISLAENESPEAVPYLRKLFPSTGSCLSIGITGAPGSGKSTLVDKLAGLYHDEQGKVGVIAVDPTSPFTGGAILGDRIRMRSRSMDAGIFIRSMATRGYLGGLAAATTDVLSILDAAGFDVVLIETVGVGQDETEIVKIAQVTLLLLVPGMGDEIQAMKAGVMEIADVFVINKSDRSEAARLQAELESVLSLGSRADGWRPPIIRTVASAGEGITECMKAIGNYREFVKTSEVCRDRLVDIQKDRLLDLVRARLTRRLLQDERAVGKLEQLARDVSDRRMDPYTAAGILLQDMNSSEP